MKIFHTNAHSPLPAGTIVGSYMLGRFVGEGGMAIVYEATNCDIGKQVALKVLHPDLARQPEMAQRFINEARFASKVTHPGLISIFDCGRADNGIYYIAMELLEGVSLEKYLKQRSMLAIPEAIVFGRQMASALAAVHQHGVVHRDLKPANIFVVEDPDSIDGKRIKVLDFGIAKLNLNSDKGNRALTRIGSVMGTPFYMSPEQWRDQPNITDKSDVYALGIILFEIVVGTTPFSGSDYQLMNDHFYRTPPAPTEIAAAVPVALSDLIMRMLNKSPEDRPSMNHAAQQLRAMVSDGASESLAVHRDALRSEAMVSGAAGAARAAAGGRARSDGGPSADRPPQRAALEGPPPVPPVSSLPTVPGKGLVATPRHSSGGTAAMAVRSPLATGASELELVRAIFRTASPEAALAVETQAEKWQKSGAPSFIAYLTEAGLLTSEQGRTIAAVHKGYVRVELKTLAALVNGVGRPLPSAGSTRHGMERGPASPIGATGRPGQLAVFPSERAEAPAARAAVPASVLASAAGAAAVPASVLASAAGAAIPERSEQGNLRPQSLAQLSGPTAAAAGESAAALPALQLGDWLEGYQVLSGLVCDDCGTRFDSFSGALNQRVAVMIAPAPFSSGLASSAAASSHELHNPRHQQEKQTLALALTLREIAHPGLAAVVKFGTAFGRRFLAYELAGEMTLDKLCLQLGALPSSQVLQLGQQVIEALSEAAQYGLTHRALFPDCVRYRSSGDISITGVGAFDLFHVVGPTALPASDSARYRPLHLSAYTPPERTAPDLGKAAAPGSELAVAEDIFSLGSLLFLAATGVSPPIPRPGAARPAQQEVALDLTRHAIPQPLFSIILRMLAPDPRDRYRSWTVLGKDFAEVQAAESFQGMRPVQSISGNTAS